jgi:hypothetical protein
LPCNALRRKVGGVRMRVQIALAAAVAMAVLPASAQALADAKIKPDPVHRGDTLKVRFKSPRDVKPRFHLQYSVLAGDGSIFECTLVKVVQTKKRPEKGERVTTYIRPRSSGGLTHKWCVGDGSVFVSYVRNSDNKGGGSLAAGGFEVVRR